MNILEQQSMNILGMNLIEKAEKERKEWQAAFDAAKPNDLINSGYGYMIRKKDYHLAQKYGYDGIELIN